MVEVSTDYAGRKLTLQTGKLAKQADGAVYCTYGETVVLATVVSSHEMREGQDFFPLTVDFQEKYYAAGKLPGGFFKREARPSDFATLYARMTDRPLRPLFPKGYMYDTQVIITVLSYDGENEPNIIGQIAASAAIHISDIPFNGPIACCRVGRVEGELKNNIEPENLENSDIDLIVSCVRDGIVMVEGGAKEVPEADMMDALDFAHKEMLPILDLQEELRKKVGKEKREWAVPVVDEALLKSVRDAATKPITKALAVRDKIERYAALDEVKKSIVEKLGSAEPSTDEEKAKNKVIKGMFSEVKSDVARSATVDSKKRIDGRGYSDIRDISCDVGLLPRTHGSAVFTRGETQVLSVLTLGTSEDEQKIDSIYGVYQKAFMLHYNFPPYSVGEARFLRGPGRREIGHGTLAERALKAVIPTHEEFPYTIRLVSEVFESNGSSSMATVCSGALAMMDAGIPLKKPVAGVAMGLIKEGDKIAVLSDILGDEDHLGDMDFKVCGTDEGITAFQMDLKIAGITRDIMEKALAQAKEGRLHILGEMNKELEAPREEMSKHAPRIHTLKINPDKIREVIGPGGKMIKSIVADTGVKMDIEDDGTVRIASTDGESAQKAISIVEGICEEAEPGRTYEGKITRIVDFGAFVEIIPNTEGLLHISELEHHRVRNVEDVVSEGEVIKVKCLEVDGRGKIRLSRKALLDQDDSGEEEDRPSRGRRDRNDSDTSDEGDEELEASGDEEQTLEADGEEQQADVDSAEESFGNRAPRSDDRGGRSSGGARTGGRDSRGRSDRGGSRDSRGGSRDSRGGSRDSRGGSRDWGRRDSSGRGGGRDRDDRGGRDRDDRGSRSRDRDDRGGRGRDRDDRGGRGGYGRDSRGGGSSSGGGRGRSAAGGRGRSSSSGGSRDGGRGRSPGGGRGRSGSGGGSRSGGSRRSS